jgi:hypothetical protein
LLSFIISWRETLFAAVPQTDSGVI